MSIIILSVITLNYFEIGQGDKSKRKTYCESLNNLVTNPFGAILYFEQEENCISSDIPIDEEFCDSLKFNRETCFRSIEETNEEYCESIYWEDEDNCIYFEPGVFTGTPEFCDKIIFESTRKACFKAIKQNKQRKK